MEWVTGERLQASPHSYIRGDTSMPRNSYLDASEKKILTAVGNVIKRQVGEVHERFNNLLNRLDLTDNRAGAGSISYEEMLHALRQLPAPVVKVYMAKPIRSRTTVVRDSDGEMVETITEFEYE
jgi:hypothetical protein